MMFSKLLLLVALCISATYVNARVPQVCNSVSECGSSEYCNTAIGYCVDCISHTDCALNEFCSTNTFDPYVFGTCVKFDKDGDSCITSRESSNIEVTNSTKCAMTYFNYGAATASQLTVDYAGQCIHGKCRMCNYADQTNGFNNGVLLSSTTAEGKQVPRTCVFPGKFASVHSAEWSPGKYYEQPIYVWLAILFCLVVLILSFHVIGFLSK